MATIERRERQSGVVYLADVRIRGFPRQKKTFKRLTDAKIWAQQTESAIRRGEFRDVHTTARKKTFKALIERYRSDVFSQKAQKTQDGEKYIVDRWDKALGKYVLSSINSELINRTLLEIEAEGDRRQKNGHKNPDTPPPTQPKSRRTMKYYRDTLAMVFKHAAKWAWIGHDPMDNVKPITNLRNERIRYLDDDERNALLAACRASSNRQIYPLVVFALSTGGRKGEILGLTLDDVDLKRGIAVFRNTKNGETRVAPLVGHLKEILQAQINWVKEKYKGMEEKPSRRWLFPSRNGQAPIDIRKPWEKARDAAGLVDFRFHDLRHSTASYLAMSGASQLEIAEVLGHRTLQMVKRYSHLSESHVKGLITRLDESIF
jgi:integrase